MIKEKREEKKRKHFIECKTKTGSHSWDKKKKRSIKHRHRHQIHVHIYLFSIHTLENQHKTFLSALSTFCLSVYRPLFSFFFVCLCFIFTFSCTLTWVWVSWRCICGLFICYVGWLDRVTTVHLSMHTYRIL